jgi:hypothetical protein
MKDEFVNKGFEVVGCQSTKIFVLSNHGDDCNAGDVASEPRTTDHPLD